MWVKDNENLGLLCSQRQRCRVLRSVILCYTIYFIFGRVSYSQGWSGTVYAAKAGISVWSSFLCFAPEASMPAVWTDRDWTQAFRHTSFSEQGPGRKLCEENFKCLWERSKNTRQESCDLSFLKAQNYSRNEGSCSSQMYQEWVCYNEIIHCCLLLLFN